jgi:hypothetical protein
MLHPLSNWFLGCVELLWLRTHPSRKSNYPYIHVEADGSARELHPDEITYLATVFHPTDGARPYIKSRYRQQDGWGEITGYLKRSRLPASIPIAAAPYSKPKMHLSREENIQFLRDKGCDVIENADGSYTAIPSKLFKSLP